MKVSSFNIRCYGLGGEYSGRFRDEKRNVNLKKFIKKELEGFDVMIFQEIVDDENFQTLLPQGYQLFSYEHPYPRHQKVAICVQEKYELRNLRPIKTMTLDDKYSRPGLFGELILKSSQESILNVIAVHLKSGVECTPKRLQQASALVDFINSLDSKSPTVVTGDFNSHSKKKTELDENDWELLSKVCETAKLSLVPNNVSTYHTMWEQQVLDHFWVSDELLKSSHLEVFDISTYEDGNLTKYYQDISDHVPIKLSFDLI